MIEKLRSLLNKIKFLNTKAKKPFDYKCYLKAKTRLNNKITRKRKKIRKIFFISILISRQKIEIPIFIFHSSCNLIQTHTHTHTHMYLIVSSFVFAGVLGVAHHRGLHPRGRGLRRGRPARVVRGPNAQGAAESDFGRSSGSGFGGRVSRSRSSPIGPRSRSSSRSSEASASSAATSRRRK